MAFFIMKSVSAATPIRFTLLDADREQICEVTLKPKSGFTSVPAPGRVLTNGERSAAKCCVRFQRERARESPKPEVLDRSCPDAPQPISNTGGNVGLIEKQAFTVQEIAAKMGVSRQTVTRLFEKEPGVIVIKRPEKMHKRSLRTIRVPHFVYQRVLRKITV